MFYSFQGFLVESKLTKLLAPLERDEQSLMKLDAIFAVGIFLSFSRFSDHLKLCTEDLGFKSQLENLELLLLFFFLFECVWLSQTKAYGATVLWNNPHSS